MTPLERAVDAVDATQVRSLTAQMLAPEAPLVLRGLVAHWPAVQAARAGVEAGVAYLGRFYRNATVCAWSAPVQAQGRFFYNDDFTGFNFQAAMVKLPQVLDRLVEHQATPQAPALYVGSTTVDTCLPGFSEENAVDFGESKPLASIWLGNRARIAAHFDVPDNLACVVAGRRRFTLFPPDQLENLYVGPLDFTPAGQAISLVDFAQPDLQRHPRFEVALRHARVAELAPGDALLLPSMWWHHVESLDSFNVLLNYWWRSTPAYMSTPVNALTHALLAVRDLPKRQREAWRDLFEHYVFDADDSTSEHIPDARRGVLGPMTDATARRVRAELLNKLNR